MYIEEVGDRRSRRNFNQFQRDLYQHDPNFISPLDSDIEKAFDPETNHYYRYGDARRWLLRSAQGQIIGRIAAFYHGEHRGTDDPDIGGIGFFDCIDDLKASRLLFETCEKWLKSKNKKGMDGPINFGEKDKFWGLMVSGFSPPSYQENYNFSYYQRLFEDYGFHEHYRQTTSLILFKDFNYDRFARLASRVTANPRYSFREFRKDQWKKFAYDFYVIYNDAWSNRPDFVPIELSRAKHLVKSMLPIVDERYAIFAYADDEPAGFYIGIPEINEVLKSLNGRFDPLSKLIFMFLLKYRSTNLIRSIVYGVIPKYHNLGLDTGMIMKFFNNSREDKRRIGTELSWIGDFNPKMHSLFEALGAKTSKIHYTYRKLF